MKTMKRRQVLKLFASAPMAAAFAWTASEAARAHQRAHSARARAVQTGAAFEPGFFTPHEYETVRVLVDCIIPRDERSGSATDAGVPEFMDFMMLDQPEGQMAMRGGLAWLDVTCQKRFNRAFLDCTDTERRAGLDEIAWPARARPEMSQGVAFFNSFRDLTATGFWTTKMGIEDLHYLGNEYVPEWTGCPEEASKKLGVSDEGE
ncbi:MAG: gluconate 2-dehydrogenase subunit 3 family protein [Acidobacteriota bacterium]